MSNLWSLGEFSDLVIENTKPQWWNSNIKLTYGFTKSLFETVEEFVSQNGGSQADLVRKALYILDPDLIVGNKLSNLKRRILNGLKNGGVSEDDICLFFYSACICNKKDGHDHDASNNFLGKIYESYKISVEVLEQILSDNSNDLATVTCPRVIIANGLVLELNNFRSQNETKYTWKSFCKWLFALSLSRPERQWNEASIRTSVNKLVLDKQVLSKNSKPDKVEELLKNEFRFPVEKVRAPVPAVVETCDMVVDVEVELEKMVSEVEYLSNIVERADDEVLRLNDKVEKGSRERKADKLEISQLKLEIKRMKVERKKIAEKLQKAVDKLGHLSTRNINKRINRRDEKNEELQEQLDRKNDELEKLEEHYDKDVKQGDAKIEQLVKKLNSAQKKTSYFKRKYETTAEPSQDLEKIQFKSKIIELSKTIAELENEKCVLEERIGEFLQQREIRTFHNGKYRDEVRDVYEDLLCLGVSAENCEKVVREVLEGLAGVRVGRLPKETFARTMYLEARRMAHVQVVEELVDKWEEESRTLLSDGTSKWHHKFTTYQVQKDDGKCLVVGMREVAAGDAETQLKVLKDIMKEVVDSSENSDLLISMKIMASIRNMMSDRCGVQKKFNNLLRDYRKEICPQVVSGWGNLCESERARLLKMNDFFCGLHLLVALADQAEAALKVWDKLIHGEEAVGSLRKGCGGYSKGGESGSYRLIRTVCKSVQERGCEKSGRPVQFQQFVQHKGEANSVPLVPFKGNRFNILFHNGGGVFYLYEDLKVFFEQVKEGNNLLRAVYHDLQVVSFLAGCRALGLVDKLVTTQLWKLLADPSVHVLDMAKHYQSMLECFSSWAEDAGSFMKGEEVLFPHIEVSKGPVYQKLVSESSFWDKMTQQVLELVFGSLTVKTTALLADHLKGGKYDLSEPNEDLKCQTVSVPKTNVEPEEVFGIVDAIMKQKPNAHAFVVESLVMQKKNNVSDWRNQLDPEKKALLRQQAIRGAREDQKLKVLKRMELQKAMEEKRAQEMEAKEAKARKERIQKAELMDKVEEVGGLWKSEEEVNAKVDVLATDKEKREALKAQIMFRKKVLGATHSDRKVFQLSTGGKVYSVQDLKSNLIAIIRTVDEERQDEQTETEGQDVEHWKQPKVLTVEQLNLQKQKMKELAKQQQEKNLQRKGEKVTHGGKKRRGEVADGETPIVAMPDDLVGKRVEHLVQHDEDSEEEWWKATVGKRTSRGRNPKFLIHYDGFDEEYEFQFSEFRKGDIRAIPVSNEDLVGKKVEILHENVDGGEEIWTVFVVISANEKVDSCTEFLVEIERKNSKYGEESDSDDESVDVSQDIFSFPLIDYYLNNALRILCA